jgi:hypothetical protein
MIFRLRDLPISSVMRPRVTPDPQRAAELERRMSALDYCPENGFHRDRRQARVAQLGGRLVAQR